MSTESEPRPIATKPENPGRRDFCISMVAIGLGGLVATVGLTMDNSRIEEARKVEEQLMSILGNKEDPAATEKAEQIKEEFNRRNFIRDRLDPALIFTGGFVSMIGVFRLLKFM